MSRYLKVIGEFTGTNEDVEVWWSGNEIGEKDRWKRLKEFNYKITWMNYTIA